MKLFDLTDLSGRKESSNDPEINQNQLSSIATEILNGTTWPIKRSPFCLLDLLRLHTIGTFIENQIQELCWYVYWLLDPFNGRILSS